MNLLEGVNRLENEFDILSFTHASYLWAKLDGMPFTEEGMQQRWEWCNDLYRRLMKCLEREFPKLKQHERQIVCDFRMHPIREHVERTESEFRCYREILEKAKEWSPALSVLIATDPMRLSNRE